MLPALVLCVVLLASGLAGFAQAPAATPPPLRAPSRPPVTVNPGVATPTRPLAGSDIIEGLAFPGADVKEVLRFYEKLTGKKLIYDVQAIGQVNIEVQGNLTRDEAVRIIEISLLMNGFTLVPADGDLVKVLGTGHNPRGFGIPIISDELQIPEGEQIITFVFKLRYADPTEVANTVQNYIVQAPSGYNQLLPLPKSQALVLTENSLIIKKVLRIIKEIDVPPAEVESEFIALTRADAKDVLEKLDKIFEKTPQGGTVATAGAAGTATAGRPAPRTTPEGTAVPADATFTATGANSAEINGGLSEDSIIVGKIRLTADTRTNRIHVITRPVNMKFVRQLIQEFDADVPFGVPAERPLRYVFAGDIFQTVVDAITEPGQKSDSSGSSSASQRPNGTSNRNSNNSTGGSSLFGNNNNNNGGTNSGFGGSNEGGSGVTLSDSLNTEERDIIPEAKIIGNTKIIADKRANSIIVLGNKEVKNKVFALLDQLDVRAPMVKIAVIIGELNLSNTKNLGVNYVLNNGNAKNLISTTGTTTTGTTGTTGTTDGTGTSAATGGLGFSSAGDPMLNLANLIGNTKVSQILTAGGGGLNGFVAAGNAFNAMVSALESTDRFHVVSRPTIVTMNNKKATIASGEEIAVPVNITGGFTGTTNASDGLVTQSSISYKTVALQLEVLPLINSDHEVTLDIVQKVDQQAGSDVIDNNSIPRIATRVLQTTVSVPSNGTVVLGGLIKESVDHSVSGIPGLMNLPLIGSLFRKTSHDKERTELVILMRPEVTTGPAADAKMREKEMEYLNIEPDLESTLYPPNKRQKVSPDGFSRRSGVDLRDDGPVDQTPLRARP